MREVSSLVLCKDYYDDEKEFKDAIHAAVDLLLDSEHVMTLEYDEKKLGIVSIRFAPRDRALGARYPYWLTFEEAEAAVFEEDIE